MKYYTGVGSRNTPQEVLDIMILIGEYLAKGEYCLRSGGAAGADKAFETGCDNANGNKRIYVPWNGFQGNTIDNEHIFLGVDTHSMKIASKHHPAWSRVGQAGQKLMARNTYQVLDWDLHRTKLEAEASMLICWTPDGAINQTTIKTGGTGQAIRIAKAYGIKVWNLQRQDHMDKIMTKIMDHQNKRK